VMLSMEVITVPTVANNIQHQYNIFLKNLWLFLPCCPGENMQDSQCYLSCHQSPNHWGKYILSLYYRLALCCKDWRRQITVPSLWLVSMMYYFLFMLSLPPCPLGKKAFSKKSLY
jgi:hypothetical protein